MTASSFRSPGRAAGVSISLALALVAQFLFTGEVFTRFRDSNTWIWPPRYTAATVLLVAAAALSAFALRPRGVTLPAVGIPSVPGSPGAAGFGLGFGAALLCYATSVALFLLRGESPAVRRAWAAGVVLFLVSLVVRGRKAFAVAGHPALEWGLVAMLTLVGFWLRFDALGELPSRLHQDVSLMGNVTLDMMSQEPDRWVGLAESGHPYATHQVQSVGFRLFGRNYDGLVMFSVFAGTATLPVLYLLGRRLFGQVVGFLAAGLLTISYTHIHFSRTLFGPIATFCVTAAIALLAEAIATGLPVFFGLAGAMLAFGLFNYDSAKVGVVIFAGVAAWQALSDPAGFRRSRRGWLLLLAGALVVYGPQIALAFTRFSEFAGRGPDVVIWNPDVLRHSIKKYKATGPLEVLFYQARSTFLTFHLFGDKSTHFELQRPIVSAPAAAFLVLGVGAALGRLRQLRAAVPVFWLLLTLLFGGVLTVDPPFWPHLNVALPAVALLAAFGAVESVRVLFPDRGKTQRLAFGLLAAGLCAVGIQNWIVYTDVEGDNAEPRTRAARYVDDLPPGARVYLRSREFQWSDDPFRFFGAGLVGRNVTREEILSRALDLSPPAAVLLYDDRDLLPLLEERYPDGVARPLGPLRGPPALIAFERVPPGDRAVIAARDVMARPGWWILGAAVLMIVVRAVLSIRAYARAQTSPP